MSLTSPLSFYILKSTQVYLPSTISIPRFVYRYSYRWTVEFRYIDEDIKILL